jgi:hypothetical protein
MIPHPPKIGNYQIVHSQVMRLVTKSLVNTTVTWQNLLDMIGVTQTAIAGSNLFSLVKIRRITVWSLGAIGTSQTVSIVFGNGSVLGQIGDFKYHTDSSMGIEPAYLNVSPDSKSQASEFQPSTANTAFSIGCPAGSTIDIHLSYKGFAGVTTLEQNALVGAAIGVVFFRGLDGLAFSATNYNHPTGVYQL